MTRRTDSDPPTPRHHLVAEVAKRYRVKPATVRTWISKKKLKAIRKGRLLRVTDAALDEFDKND